MGDKTMYYCRSGCTVLDLCVGGAEGVLGFPMGKFVNIVGDKSAGKTFLAMEIVAWCYHNLGDKFRWVYDDCESGFSFNPKDLYGFDIIPEDESEVVKSETVEECFCNISNFANSLKKDEFGLYVVDSLDGLTSYEQNDRAQERLKLHKQGKELDKGTYGMGKPKYLSQEFFPQLCSTIKEKNILVIIVSQIREKIDMFSFEKYSRNGGKAMDFYAHTVLWLATLKKIEKKDKVVGVVVKAKTTKSKTPRPFRDCVFSFLYDYGLDNIGSCVDYVYDLRTPGGELNAKAKAISGASGEVSLEQWLKFLNDCGLVEKFEKSKYKKEKYSAEDVFAFVVSKKEYKEKQAEYFKNETKTREELIAYIEDNNLEDELNKQVIDKWEAFEKTLKSERKKKYGTIPQGEK